MNEAKRNKLEEIRKLLNLMTEYNKQLQVAINGVSKTNERAFVQEAEIK